MKKLSSNFNRLSLDQKVITLIAIEVIAFCVITWVAYTQVKVVGNEVRQMTFVTSPLSDSIRNIQARINSLRLNIKTISVNSFQADNQQTNYATHELARSAYLEEFIALSDEIETFKVLIREPITQQDDHVNILALYRDNLLAKLSDLSASIQNHRSALMQLAKKIEVPPHNVNTMDLTGLTQVDIVLQNNLSLLITEFDTMKQAATRQSVYVERIAIGFIVLTSIAAFIFFITVLLLIVRKNISKPLQLLTDTINAFTALHKVDESEFEKVLMMRGDELGRLSRSFNRLKA